MSYKENLTRATELKAELDSFRPLTSEMEQRIMQKFRLDWNYHSSHIEGNQLTYGETKALLLFGHTAQAKPLKDHVEMTGHNEAIKYIEEVIRQERPLTETFIRELHQLILKEPYEIDAETPDGKATKRMITIGAYKTVPNHVKTITGEMFYFANPEETPAKMNDLMDWYSENLNNISIHPILFATEFHYRFICIHPFDDGNGRLARLLMNFILMSKGYPPAIIKTEEKDAYFAALQQADAGQIDYFFNYICEQENKSLELMIKGAKGEDIEEPNDIDKKIAMLTKELEAVDINNEVKYTFNKKVFTDIFHGWLGELIMKSVSEIQKFNHLFTGTNHWIRLANNTSITFVNQKPERIYKDLDDQFAKSQGQFIEHDSQTLINCAYGPFKKGGLNTFGCNYSVEVKFDMTKYVILVDDYVEPGHQRKQKQLFERLLHQPITADEIQNIATHLANTIFEHIDVNTKKIGLR